MQALHEIKNRVESLSFQIKNIAKYRFENIYERRKREAINKDYQYNLAEVIANIIINVSFVDKSKIRFQKVIDCYNHQHSTKLKYQYFLDNCLIREIIDEVIIPGVVRSSLRNTNILEIDTDYYNCLKEYYSYCEVSKNIIKPQDICNIISTFGRGSFGIDLLLEQQILKKLENADDFEFCIEHNFYLFYLSNEISAHIIMRLSGSCSLLTILRANLYNFGKLKDILLPGNLNSICYDASCRLLNENDLNNSDDEIRKIWFDQSVHRNNALTVPNMNMDFLTAYDLISFVNNSPHWIREPFSIQCAREKYNALLDIIICTSSYDFNVSTNKHNYQSLLELLKNISKPYITYTLYKLIQNKYPFLAPYLLVDSDTAHLGLEVIDNIEINLLIHNSEENRATQLKKELQIKSDLWIEMFNLVLDQIDNCCNMNEAVQYQYISDVFINLAKKIFNKISIHGNGDNSQHEYFRKKYTSAINIILSKKFYTSPYANKTLPRMIFSLLPMLLDKGIRRYEVQPLM